MWYTHELIEKTPDCEFGTSVGNLVFV